MGSLSGPSFSGFAKSSGIMVIVSKECYKNIEGIYLQRSEARGRVRGKLQGAISAEKWE